MLSIGCAKKYFSCFLCFLCFLSFSPARANSWFGGIHLAAGGADAGKKQNLTLFTSTSPVVVDQYDASHNSTKFSGVVGLEGGYRLSPYHDWQADLSASALYLGYSKVNGKMHPLVNVASDFDPLSFQYNVQSYVLGVAPSLTRLTQGAWNPVVSCLIGVSWNRAYRYNEWTPMGSTAAPSGLIFGNKTVATFAFAPRIGFQHAINDHYTARIGFEYFNAGSAKLNPMPTQETRQAINSGNLSAYFASFDLLIA